MADYFIICHGNSDKQVQAIAREMKDKVLELGMTLKESKALMRQDGFLLILEMSSPIFSTDERGYYNLERLWGDAPLENIQSELSQ